MVRACSVGPRHQARGTTAVPSFWFTDEACAELKSVVLNVNDANDTSSSALPDTEESIKQLGFVSSSFNIEYRSRLMDYSKARQQ